MAKTPEEQQIIILEQIKRLLILALDHQKVKGKRMAQVMDIDPAVISRILSAQKKGRGNE